MSNYLVTGGAGFIGSHIVEHLVREGHLVKVLDNFCEGKRENLAQVYDEIELIEADIRDLETTKEVCKRVDYVLHQAALRSVAKSMKDPVTYAEVNVMGTLNVLMAAKEAQVKRLVYASSSSVYGDTERFPNVEDQLPRPISPYATSKLAGEYYCRLFSKAYGLEAVSLRYFNVFGPRQDPASEYAAVVPKFITRMLEGQHPIVDGDGLQSRDFTYVDNVVRANILAAQTPGVSGEVFNVSCGQDFSVLDIVDVLNQTMNASIKPEFGPPRPGDVRRTLGDVSKARRLLGCEAEIGFHEGLKRSLLWFEENG